MQVVRRSTEVALMALIAILCVGLLSVGVRSAAMVFDLPLTEDGYYVMTVARNVARGVGFSADGKTWTNGFHPLWAVVSSLAFLVGAGSDELSMRVVLFASAATAIMSAVLWSRIFAGAFGADKRLYRLCFVLVYLSSFQLLVQHFNGLETGLLLALLATTGLYWVSSEPSFGRNAVLGVLLGLLVLMRIDAGVFAAVVALEALWRGRRDLGRTIAQVFVMGVAATLVAGPWFAYNLALTGKLMPVSGLALAIEGPPTDPIDRLITTGTAILRNGVGNILGELSRMACLLFLLLVAGLTFLLLHRGRSLPWQAAASARMRRCWTYVAMVAIYLAIVVVYYAIDSAATFFYQRYFILASLLAVGPVAYLFYRLAGSAPSFVVVPVAIVLAGFTVVTVLGWHGLPFGKRLNDLQAEQNGGFLGQVELARSQRRPGEIVGGIQSGTLAFFIEGAINLDGRVNWAAYQARRAGKLMDYVLAERIGLLVDHSLLFKGHEYGYFPPDDDPAKYFQQVAPPGTPRLYGWVALRRRPDQGR